MLHLVDNLFIKIMYVKCTRAATMDATGNCNEMQLFKIIMRQAPNCREAAASTHVQNHCKIRMERYSHGIGKTINVRFSPKPSGDWLWRVNSSEFSVHDPVQGVYVIDRDVFPTVKEVFIEVGNERGVD